MAQAAGKVIVVATIGEPPTLDPVGVTADLVSIISQHIFETLYTFDSEWKVTPLLAAGPPVIGGDGKSFTIPLRKSVTVQKGREMTADDVVAPPERWTTPSPRGQTTPRRTPAPPPQD